MEILVTTQQGLAASDWAAILQGGAAIVTVGLAVYGITSWQKEARGKRRLELAEDVLTTVYEAQDAIRSIRSNAIVRDEIEQATKGSGDIGVEVANVLRERYNNNAETFRRLRVLRFRFQAHFGAEAGESLQDFHRGVDRIFDTLETLPVLYRRLERFEELGKDTNDVENRIEKAHDILFFDPRADAFDDRLAESVKRVEQMTGSLLGRK